MKVKITQNAMFNSFCKDAAPKVSTSSRAFRIDSVVDHCGLLRLCLYEWRRINPEIP